MIAAARQAAYDVLRAVNGSRADLPNALARVRNRLPDERDRALAGEIATGTLRWQAAFDRVIAEFARRPIEKLDPEVVDILRLTIFQILHLDRVPTSAAVNDAVNLTRKVGKKSAAPLVNALLRRVSRERHKLPLPAREAGVDYLAVSLSHPRWLVERWVERYGFDAAEAWAQFDNAPAALTLRVNTLQATREAVAAALTEAGIDVEPTRHASDGLIVRSGNPLQKGGWHFSRKVPATSPTGFFVQDEASQLVAVFADAQPGERVLDLCASPGGKTTAMAAAMRDEGFVVASDVRGRRIQLLQHTIASSGATIVRIVQADAAKPLPFDAQFDRILLDAPCSGLGTLRRDPDIRWRRHEADLPMLAAAQVAMLQRAADVLKIGGRLIYATCSSEPDENEAVVERFLSAHAGFRVLAPEACPPLTRRFLTREGYFRTLPYRDQLEAFFAAMLVKTKDLR